MLWLGFNARDTVFYKKINETRFRIRLLTKYLNLQNCYTMYPYTTLWMLLISTKFLLQKQIRFRFYISVMDAFFNTNLDVILAF